jgi:hypothetical protein
MTNLIIPLLLQLVKWFFDRKAANQEMKQRFIEFCSEYEKSAATPVAIRNKYQSQVDELSAPVKSDISSQKNSLQ